MKDGLYTFNFQKQFMSLYRLKASSVDMTIYLPASFLIQEHVRFVTMSLYVLLFQKTNISITLRHGYAHGSVIVYLFFKKI